VEGFCEQPKIQASTLQVDKRCVGLVLRKAIEELNMNEED